MTWISGPKPVTCPTCGGALREGERRSSGKKWIVWAVVLMAIGVLLALLLR
jgi:hypothetical protein